MKALKKILPKIIPNELLLQIRLMLAPEEKKAKRKLVLNDPKNANTEIPEIQEALKYLKNRPFTSFPYFWTLKYENYNPEIFKDQGSGFSYIIFNGFCWIIADSLINVKDSTTSIVSLKFFLVC